MNHDTATRLGDFRSSSWCCPQCGRRVSGGRGLKYPLANNLSCEELSTIAILRLKIAHRKKSTSSWSIVGLVFCFSNLVTSALTWHLSCCELPCSAQCPSWSQHPSSRIFGALMVLWAGKMTMRHGEPNAMVMLFQGDPEPFFDKDPVEPFSDDFTALPTRLNGPRSAANIVAHPSLSQLEERHVLLWEVQLRGWRQSRKQKQSWENID
jgi:hypothetical protein